MIITKIEGVGNLARKLNRTLPDAALKELRGAVKEEAKSLADRMLPKIPVRTGATAQEFKTRITGKGLMAWIGVRGPRAYIARFLETGAKPHLIKAGKGKLLAIKGQVIGREAHHPGFKPKPWRIKLGDSERLAFQQKLREKIITVLREINNP